MKTLTLAEIRRRIRAIESDPATASATIFGRSHDNELRAALESRRGETYTEHEWDEARANLLNFFALLAEWKEKDDRART